MISIIVPVYNVEPYLEKCLNSIVNQSYKDLEIILIDDGSTDRCGTICDKYAAKDERIRVIHTENKGLSSARNLGLDVADGEYIGFIDSDDWIEPDMYECLINKAKETDADVVECGVYQEYENLTKEKRAINRMVSGEAALEALITGEIRTQVWNKIWKESLFYKMRFPEGRDYEDILTTYKLLQVSRVVGVRRMLYHYIQRSDGISQNHDIKNLTDNWLAHKERYESLSDTDNEEIINGLLKGCAFAIARRWVWYLESFNSSEYINEMCIFVRNHYSLFGDSGWPLNLRLCVFLARYDNIVSFTIAYLLNKLYGVFKPKYISYDF